MSLFELVLLKASGECARKLLRLWLRTTERIDWTRFLTDLSFDSNWTEAGKVQSPMQ
jgi:hypothetical protein